MADAAVNGPALHLDFHLEAPTFELYQQQRQQLQFQVTTTCWDHTGSSGVQQQLHAFRVQPECPQVLLFDADDCGRSSGVAALVALGASATVEHLLEEVELSLAGGSEAAAAGSAVAPLGSSTSGSGGDSWRADCGSGGALDREMEEALQAAGSTSGCRSLWVAPHTRVAFIDSLALEAACAAGSLWAVPAMQVLENRAPLPACFAVAEGDAPEPGTPAAGWAVMSGTVSRTAALAVAYSPPGGVAVAAGSEAAQLQEPLPRPAAKAAAPLLGPAGSSSSDGRALDLELSHAASSRISTGGHDRGAMGRAALARQLADSPAGNGSAPVSATLLPGTTTGAVTLDAYSGLPRRITAADLPICSADEQQQQSQQCLQEVTLRTRQRTMLLSLQLGSPTSRPLTTEAVVCAGGGVESVSSPGVLSGGQLYDVTVALPADGQPVKCYLPPGQLQAWGVNNAASNELVLIRDIVGPKPVLSTPDNHLVTDSSPIGFNLDFGEQVLSSDPRLLFNLSGTQRYEAVLDSSSGQLSVLAYVEARGQPADISLSVNGGVVADLVGNLNAAGASVTVLYRPTSSSLDGLGVAANVVFGGLMASCLGANYLVSWLHPFAPGVVGCGALSLLGYIQTFYLTGQLSAAWLPHNYRAVADKFAWSVGEIQVPWAESMPDPNPQLGFPHQPVALTSAGQEVLLRQYPTYNSSGSGGAGTTPIIAITGVLDPIAPGTTPGTTVLPGIPFLPPDEAQQLLSVPPPPVAPPPSPTDPAGTPPPAPAPPPTPVPLEPFSTPAASPPAPSPSPSPVVSPPLPTPLPSPSPPPPPPSSPPPSPRLVPSPPSPAVGLSPDSPSPAAQPSPAPAVSPVAGPLPAGPLPASPPVEQPAEPPAGQPADPPVEQPAASPPQDLPGSSPPFALPDASPPEQQPASPPQELPASPPAQQPMASPPTQQPVASSPELAPASPPTEQPAVPAASPPMEQPASPPAELPTASPPAELLAASPPAELPAASPPTQLPVGPLPVLPASPPAEEPALVPATEPALSPEEEPPLVPAESPVPAPGPGPEADTLAPAPAPELAPAPAPDEVPLPLPSPTLASKGVMFPPPPVPPLSIPPPRSPTLVTKGLSPLPLVVPSPLAIALSPAPAPAPLPGSPALTRSPALINPQGLSPVLSPGEQQGTSPQLGTSLPGTTLPPPNPGRSPAQPPPLPPPSPSSPAAQSVPVLVPAPKAPSLGAPSPATSLPSPAVVAPSPAAGLPSPPATAIPAQAAARPSPLALSSPAAVLPSPLALTSPVPPLSAAPGALPSPSPALSAPTPAAPLPEPLPTAPSPELSPAMVPAPAPELAPSDLAAPGPSPPVVTDDSPLATLSPSSPLPSPGSDLPAPVIEFVTSPSPALVGASSIPQRGLSPLGSSPDATPVPSTTPSPQADAGAQPSPAGGGSPDPVPSAADPLGSSPAVDPSSGTSRRRALRDLPPRAVQGHLGSSHLAAREAFVAAVQQAGAAGALRRQLQQQQLQNAQGSQPAWQGQVFVVVGSGNGQVLAGMDAVNRAYDVMDLSTPLPRHFYYDRFARAYFWAAVLLAGVMCLHVAWLAALMWRRASVPNVLWFPRVEIAASLAVLPILAWGSAALFNGDPGDIVLAVALLVALPLAFLAGCGYLLTRWLLLPKLAQRRAVFVLASDPARPPRPVMLPAPLGTRRRRGQTALGNVQEPPAGPDGSTSYPELPRGEESASDDGLGRMASGLKALRSEELAGSEASSSSIEPGFSTPAKAGEGVHRSGRAAGAAGTDAFARPALDLAAAQAAGSPASNGRHDDIDSAREPQRAAAKRVSKFAAKQPSSQEGQSGESGSSSSGSQVGDGHQERVQEEQQRQQPQQLPKGRRLEGLAAAARALCGARPHKGTWISLHLDSRFTNKYGVLFEGVYGQPLVRKGATYEWDPAKCEANRGALVPWLEPPLLSVRGRTLVHSYWLRTFSQLLLPLRLVVLAAVVSGVMDTNNVAQVVALLVLYVLSAVALLVLRPFNSAALGALELAATLAPAAVFAATLAVMDGRGADSGTRDAAGTAMLACQGIGFLCYIVIVGYTSCAALAGALPLRRWVGLRPSRSDRLAGAVVQVMSRDPTILARKFADRWMVHALGYGLLNRPVWRRETEDLRRLLLTVVLPSNRRPVGSAVRRKAGDPLALPPPAAAAQLGAIAEEEEEEGDKVLSKAESLGSSGLKGSPSGALGSEAAAFLHLPPVATRAASPARPQHAAAAAAATVAQPGAPPSPGHLAITPRVSPNTSSAGATPTTAGRAVDALPRSAPGMSDSPSSPTFASLLSQQTAPFGVASSLHFNSILTEAQSQGGSPRLAPAPGSSPSGSGSVIITVPAQAGAGSGGAGGSPRRRSSGSRGGTPRHASSGGSGSPRRGPTEAPIAEPGSALFKQLSSQSAELLAALGQSSGEEATTETAQEV
ncbi:hypothetical protein N2152v2_005215 [Parachlorella kessleri]